MADELDNSIEDEPGIAAEADQPGEQDDKRRAAWLPWVVLLVAILVLAWLFWHYGRVPTARDDRAAVAIVATVPDVVGMSAASAVNRIEGAGFVAEQDSAYSSDAEPGAVAAQAPEGGTKSIKGDLVVIVVAEQVGEASGAALQLPDEENRVPSVIGLTELRAEELLSARGYGLAVSKGYSTTRVRGVIYSQSPEAGAAAGPGITVDAKVSLGPPPPGQAQVPYVIGLTSKQAIALIEDAGFDPRSMKQWREGGVSNRVFQQDPAAGLLKPVGSKVFILAAE